MRNRVYYLDVIRCVACLMVVMMHAPLPGGLSGFIVVPISLATAPCIGLFFMVSGALLLPSKENGFIFLKKRIGKVLAPVLFWTMVSIIVSGVTNGWPDASQIIRKFLSIPFSVQGHGVLWFMYVLVGLYLLAPIISPWLEKAGKREIELYLLLWLVSMCYPILKLFLKINDSPTGILYYFSGYVGYFVLGYYLRRTNCIHISKIVKILFLIMPFALLGLCKAVGYEVDFYSVFWYLSILIALMCYSLFCIAKENDVYFGKLSARTHKYITQFSNLSFGIYLCHIFIMHNVLWNFIDISIMGGWVALLISFLGTLILSYIVSLLISYLPFGDYIIGYKRRK